jgi:hypothetical protein
MPSRRRGRGRKHAKPLERHELKAQNLFTDEVQQKILDEVHELFDGTYSVIRPGPWKRSFRPSGFPYCPVIDALSGNEEMDYAKAFYLEIGTIVHALMQEYISRSIRGRRSVYANWKCKKCGGMHEFTPLPFCCAHCGADNEELAYEELEFSYFLGIDGGHVDLLIKTSFGWIVCDWKTASTTGLDFRNEADGKHHHQLQAYCEAISKLFKHKLQGLPVIGYMLIFVPRDASGMRSGDKVTGSNWTPYLYQWNEQTSKETRKRLFIQRASYDAASIGYETNNWLPAAMLRPCTSLVEFGKPMGMKDAFYGGKLCENLDICCRSTAEVAEAITSRRAQMKLDEENRTTLLAKQREEFLQCAMQGFVSPKLLAEIKLAADADDYEHEYHESLLAIKESLEWLIDTRKALLADKIGSFFDAAEPPKPAVKDANARLARKIKGIIKRIRR